MENAQLQLENAKGDKARTLAWAKINLAKLNLNLEQLRGNLPSYDMQGVKDCQEDVTSALKELQEAASKKLMSERNFARKQASFDLKLALFEHSLAEAVNDGVQNLVPKDRNQCVLSDAKLRLAKAKLDLAQAKFNLVNAKDKVNREAAQTGINEANGKIDEQEDMLKNILKEFGKPETKTPLSSFLKEFCQP